MKDKQDEVVYFNHPVKIRFLDGEEMFVLIIDRNSKEMHRELPANKVCYWCSKETPLGQALFGHTIGDWVEYKVAGNTLKVQILDIESSGKN